MAQENWNNGDKGRFIPPIMYETEEDLSKEAEFKRKIEKRFRCTCTKLHKSHGFDFIATRNGEEVALIEIKCRNIGANDYEESLVDVNKIKAGKNWRFPVTIGVGN